MDQSSLLTRGPLLLTTDLVSSWLENPGVGFEGLEWVWGTNPSRLVSVLPLWGGGGTSFCSTAVSLSALMKGVDLGPLLHATPLLFS